MDVLKELIDWYRNNCDGDWEHEYGIRIETLDNPGWFVEIDLADTPMDGRTFSAVVIERAQDDWVNCTVEERKYRAAGGPGNLRELLQLFCSWLQG